MERGEYKPKSGRTKLKCDYVGKEWSGLPNLEY